MNSLGAAEHVAPAQGLYREGVALPDSRLCAPAGAVVVSLRSIAILSFSTAVVSVLTLTGSGKSFLPLFRL